MGIRKYSPQIPPSSINIPPFHFHTQYNQLAKENQGSYSPEYARSPIETVFKRESEVAQSCLTLGDPMDCSLPGSSIHGIFQAKVPEWVAIAFSKTGSRGQQFTLCFCIEKHSPLV